MYPFEIAITALLTVFWVITLSAIRRVQRRNQRYDTRHPCPDDRDSLAMFRRIMGR